MICKFCEEGTLKLFNRDIWGTHIGLWCQCDNCAFMIEMITKVKSDETTVEEFLKKFKEKL